MRPPEESSNVFSHVVHVCQMSRITEVSNSLIYADIVAERKLDITGRLAVA